MRVLTICQPFAELIVADANTLPPGQTPKRVENRSWPTSHRGSLAIHAGKSTAWFENEEWSTSEYPVPMGAIVGVVDLLDCLHIDRITGRDPDIVTRFPWITSHEHAEGRFCWVLGNVRRLTTPIAWNGSQGLWFVPDKVLEGKPLIEVEAAYVAR